MKKQYITPGVNVVELGKDAICLNTASSPATDDPAGVRGMPTSFEIDDELIDQILKLDAMNK